MGLEFRNVIGIRFGNYLGYSEYEILIKCLKINVNIDVKFWKGDVSISCIIFVG